MSSSETLDRLEHDGFVKRVDGRFRTTRRFQGAMARAARRLQAVNDPGSDLRVAIALALFESYGEGLDDDALASLVDAMLPIEIRELFPTIDR